MIKTLKNTVKKTDGLISGIYLKHFTEKSSLITFLFHGIFKDQNEIDLNFADPQQRFTLEHFRLFVEYYLQHDYLFVSPRDILNGLSADKKYVLITFDDGYYNNQRILPILREYNVPAVFYFSVNHIKDYKCFWWDVLYREGLKTGKSAKELYAFGCRLKFETNAEIERQLKQIFGNKVFEPVSDTDRPFSLSELKDFAREKQVYLGNHTYDHAILTNYSLNQVKSQIKDAQEFFYNLTGTFPESISYPSGKYSQKILEITEELGLKLGVTIKWKKNYLPLRFEKKDPLRLGRFLLNGEENLINQCQIIRSDIVFYNYIRKFLDL